MEPMLGDLFVGEHRLARAGFMCPGLSPQGFTPGPSIPIFNRAAGLMPETPESAKHEEMLLRLESLKNIERHELTGDINQILYDLGMKQAQLERAILTTNTAFPVRENLEAEAKILIPLDTPVRNRLRRIPGSGIASAWRQATSLGGGYGASTTVTTGASSATQTVGSTAGLQAGDSVYFAVSDLTRIVSSITSATVLVLTATISTTTAEAMTKVGVQGPSGAAIRSFFVQDGAPAEHTTVYAAKSLSYKLLGTYGSVSGFAMAAGANFQPQLATEKANALRNLMLNEENALINGSLTDVAAPWGDGSTAMGFNGLRNSITTALGTPAAQVQAAVGALTTAHLDAQLSRLWNQGSQNLWMLMNEQETRSLAHLGEASGSIIRVQATTDGQAVLGIRISGYVHPVTGRLVEIIPSRFMSPGVIIFGCDMLPDGTPAADVDVLPQVELPQLAPNENIQGYTAQELAPSLTAPQVHAFIVSVYEVLRVKSAIHFGISSGVTAV